MATQVEIKETLRKPKQLRKLLREAIATERRAEKEADATKETHKTAVKVAKAATGVRRSLEDELERSCSAFDEEW